MEIEKVTESNLRLIERVIKVEDPEMLQEFQSVLDGIKFEDTNNDDQDDVLLSENDRIVISERCRLCASKKNDMVHIYGENKTCGNIIEKIKSFLPIVINEDDNLPKHACHPCLEKLESFHTFYKNVKKAEEQLTILNEKISDKLRITKDDNPQDLSISSDKQSGFFQFVNIKTDLKDSSEEEEYSNNNERTSEEIQIPNNSSLSNSLIHSAAELFPSELNCRINNLKDDNEESNSCTRTREKKTTDLCISNPENFGKASNSRIIDSNSKLKTKNFADYNLFSKIIRCRICGLSFRTVLKCYSHSSIHALEENYYPCSICDKSFETLKEWKEHSPEHSEDKNFAIRKASHVCNDCGRKFITDIKLQFHKIHHCSADARSSCCKKCNTVMDSKEALYQHMISIHAQDVREHLCDICGQKFRTQSQLNSHKGKHYAKLIKEFSCVHCGKSFTRKSYLIIHIRSHTGERPFSCDFCDKSYKTQTQRNNHRRTHTGEKPFKCPTCGKAFAQALRLSEHANVHVVTRPYKCSFCEKSFKRIHARNIHMTTHTGEKKYQCEVCGKDFRWPSAMRRHKKDQHGIKKT